jgi:hypothetical protein
MKKWGIHGLCMLMAGAMTVFAVGCGDDDKGNNSTGDLTEEEQYQLASSLMMASPGLMLQNFGSQYWDGVDPEDFTFNFFGLGKAVPPGLGKRLPPALARPMQLEADTVIYVFANGWWKFHVEYSLDDDTSGFEVTVLVDDSIQFLTGTSTPQITPNELTETFVHQGELTLQVSIDGDSVATSVGIGGENDFTVTGLNEANVVVNGSTDASIDFALDTDSVEADIHAGFFGDVDNVITANEPSSCPESGNFTLGFDMDFEVRDGDDVVEASGDWEVHVDFLGEGMAHVEIHAEDGDFEAEGDQFICEAPEE